MHLGDPTNGNVGSNTPIPDTITDTITNIYVADATSHSNDESFKKCFSNSLPEDTQNSSTQTNRSTVCLKEADKFVQKGQSRHYIKKKHIKECDVANAPSSSSFSSAIKRTNNVQNAPPKNLPSQAIQLAALLLELIQVRSPKAKADINEWAKHIDKMNRIDKFSWLEIENIIRYVHQKDKFWFKAVLSAKKLREKASTLVIYMNDYQDDKDPQKEFNDYFS